MRELLETCDSLTSPSRPKAFDRMEAWIDKQRVTTEAAKRNLLDFFAKRGISDEEGLGRWILSDDASKSWQDLVSCLSGCKKLEKKWFNDAINKLRSESCSSDAQSAADDDDDETKRKKEDSFPLRANELSRCDLLQQIEVIEMAIQSLSSAILNVSSAGPKSALTRLIKSKSANVTRLTLLHKRLDDNKNCDDVAAILNANAIKVPSNDDLIEMLRSRGIPIVSVDPDLKGILKSFCCKPVDEEDSCRLDAAMGPRGPLRPVNLRLCWTRAQNTGQ